MPNNAKQIPSNFQQYSNNTKAPKLLPDLLMCKYDFLLQGGVPNHPPTHLPQLLQLDDNIWRRKEEGLEYNGSTIHNNQPTNSINNNRKKQQQNNSNSMTASQHQHNNSNSSTNANADADADANTNTEELHTVDIHCTQ